MQSACAKKTDGNMFPSARFLCCKRLVLNLGGFEQLLGFGNGALTELAIDFARFVEQISELLERTVRSRESFAFTAVFLIREIFGEGSAGTTEAKTPALECRGFVCETR